MGQPDVFHCLVVVVPAPENFPSLFIHRIHRNHQNMAKVAINLEKSLCYQDSVGNDNHGNIQFPGLLGYQDDVVNVCQRLAAGERNLIQILMQPI